jgi:uncharacterized membrane protein (DUF106 family)
MIMGFLGVSLPFGAEIIIIALSLVYTVVVVLLQRKLSNPKRAREVQSEIKRLTNELNALVRSNASKELQAAKQSEVMKLMGESMRSMIKPMIVIGPAFLIIYYVMLPALPLGAGVVEKSVQSLFFYTVLVMGLISSAVILLYDRKMIKKEQQKLKDDEKDLQEAEKGDLGLKTQGV